MNIICNNILKWRLLCVAAAIFAAYFALCNSNAMAAEGSASASRAFKADVSLTMALTAASAEARVAAVKLAVQELSHAKEVQLFLGNNAMRAAPRPEPVALGWMMLESEQVERSVGGVPPDMQAHVVLRLKLKPPRHAAQVLAQPEQLDIYTRAVSLQEAALEDYDAAAVFFLQPGTSRSGGSDAQTAAERLNSAFSRLEGAGTYLAVLPVLYPEGVSIPADEDGSLLSLLEELCSAAPENYLFLSELGRLRLLHGHVNLAMEAFDKSIMLRPDFAQNYERRGHCLLWLELPSLALADFSRAISMEPYHPGFFESRGLAHRVLEDIPAMCDDFLEGCRLGECSAYEWAVSEGLCGR